MEKITLSEVSQAQKAKTTCSPTYVHCKPKTNAAILRDLAQNKERLHMGGIQGKETKNFNVFDVLMS
jgi:hypothetical protein